MYTEAAIQQLLSMGLTQKETAQKIGCSQSTVAYYVQKYNLQRTKTCKYCKTENNNDFNPRARTVCKHCKNQKYIQRWISLKQKAIDYLGGKCTSCGYNKYYGALEFHHVDPNTKDTVWNHLKKRSWDRIIVELDKCQLLCSNCHKEIHAGRTR
jgi:hypothetical protein